MTEQLPSSWESSKIGSRAPAGGGPSNSCVPSRASQPQLLPAAVAADAKSISSHAFWPTSPIHTSFVAGRTRSATGCAARTSRSPGARRPGRRTGCRPGSCTASLPFGRRVDAQDLPEELPEVLGPLLGVAARAAVAERDVQHAVGSERDLAAVVVRIRILDEEQLAPRMRCRRRRRPSCTRRRACRRSGSV